MLIGIVGRGTVGNALGLALSQDNMELVKATRSEVFYWDLDPSKRTVDSLHDLLNGRLDLIFVCLPTPQVEGSLRCDTSILDDFFNFRLGKAQLEEEARKNCFVVKSTVDVGWTKQASKNHCLPNLCHSPEFLTARTAVEDADRPTRNVIGEPGYTEFSEQTECADKLQELYERRWPHVPIHFMSSDESEAVKLFQNSFSAVKIAFFNEIRLFADKMGMDWDRVLKALLAGGWINPQHTQVPGPDGKFGFGGSCLPKDLANLTDSMYRANVDPQITVAALGRNERDRLRVK